jgi:hypothetical protein
MKVHVIVKIDHFDNYVSVYGVYYDLNKANEIAEAYNLKTSKYSGRLFVYTKLLEW